MLSTSPVNKSYINCTPVNVSADISLILQNVTLSWETGVKLQYYDLSGFDPIVKNNQIYNMEIAAEAVI